MRFYFYTRKEKVASMVLWMAFLVSHLGLSSCGQISSNCVISPSSLVSWSNGESLNGSTLYDLRSGLFGSALNLSRTEGVRGLGLTFLPYNSSATLSSSIDSTNGMSIAALVKSNYSGISPTRQTILSQGEVASTYTASRFSFLDPSTLFPGVTNFVSSVFDGRYVYYNPFGASTLLLQYDTQGSGYSSSSAWNSFDLTSTIPGVSLSAGSIFDGRHIYFSTSTSKIARFDTSLSFSSAQAWDSIDVSAINSIVTASVSPQYYDGKAMYFYLASSTILLKYDVGLPISSSAAWKIQDLSAFSPSSVSSTAPWGRAFDGRYVYFGTLNGPAGGLVGKYDTQQDFNDSSAWSFVDISSFNANAVKFSATVFDGRYVYFPSGGGSATGMVSRLDTTGEFTSSAAWTFFATTSLNALAKGNDGGFTDGRYIYFTGFNSTFATRFDPSQDFSTASSWELFDLSALDASAKWLWSAVSDGRYFYYSPQAVNKIVRYDSLDGASKSIDLAFQMISSDGFSESVSGPSFQVTTSSGTYQAISKTPLTDGKWHWLIGSYDNNTLSLYVDGILVDSKTATGPIITSTEPFRFGTNGNTVMAGNITISDIQLYDRALSSKEIQNIAAFGLCR